MTGVVTVRASLGGLHRIGLGYPVPDLGATVDDGRRLRREVM